MPNKVAIITGASKGIGRQTALAFAAADYHVVLIATNLEALQLLESEISELYNLPCLICCGDLSDETFVMSISGLVAKKFARIDVLVNNAAWRTIETMRTISLENWEKTVRICLTAPAFLARSCAALMEKQNIAGTIINISSVMSQRAAGSSPAYIACKGALESLTRELAVTYGRSSIRVLCIRAGFIDTEMSSDYTNEKGDNISSLLANDLINNIPAQRPGTPFDIARSLVWLSSTEASYISGCDITIDGGLSSNFNSYSIKKLQFPKEY
jgi:NAD(P)-dependent dehydrogenase (short-subunit alcohol dehydrogenase family)